jgi:quinol-cytochrome oxidoreductase complex cytochrome b subunit
MLLHEVGSSQVHGSTTSSDNGPFGPLYFTKDWFGLSIFLFFYFYVVIYYPNLLGHPENFNPANPLVTPRHIVPEWYFLPFYAILRSVPSKLGGVMLMTWSLIMFFFLPSFWPLDGPSRSPSYTPLYDYTFTIFITSFISLGFFGSCPVSWVYILFSRVCTLAYFLCFFLFYLAIHLDRKATRLFFFFFGPIAEHTCL